jgi:hypothetical protein
MRHAFRYMLGPGVCGLAAGGKRIRTFGATVNNAAVLFSVTSVCAGCGSGRPVIADGNIGEPGQPPQIDQQARGRQAEGEKRHQALSPGDDERLGVRRERVQGV